jgi:ribosomal protein S18 acetylase RimI-like enzyme
MEKYVIRAIEELSMNAWPVMQTLHYDGWVLRCAEGYTKRANSVYPLYPSEIDVDEKIEFCESFYRIEGLPTVFKMTEASTPSHLEDRLDALGYRMDSPTGVQLLELRAGNHEVARNVSLTSIDTEEWHTAFARMNHVDDSRRAMHEGILRAILLEKCYATINENGHILGCGLGVLQAGYLGIFDIVIDPDQRGQGYGERLMAALLAWGAQQGARTAYLQVMCNNEPALRLYEKLGFREKYQYWYRIKT